MVSLTHGLFGANSAASTTTNTTSAGTTTTASVNSFAQQLAAAIEGYLGNSGSSSQFEIDVTAPSGQNSAAGSQFTVTVKSLGTGTDSTTAASTTTSAATTT